MKNLVKKTRIKSWVILSPALIVSTVLFYCLFLAFFAWLANSLNANVTEFGYTIKFLYLIGFAYGVMTTVYISNKIWKVVDRQVLSNKECRNAHHISLIKKYILLGDKERSEKLLDQYNKSNYKNDKMLYFYYGAYDLKFFDLDVVKVLSSINFKKDPIKKY